MKAAKPLMAFTLALENDSDGPEPSVFSNAYGLEMSLSDSCPMQIMMMAPPHLMPAITDRTDILKRGMLVGASYVPSDASLKQIKENDGTWVVTRLGDDPLKILNAGLGVLLTVGSLHDEAVIKITDFLRRAQEKHQLSAANLIIALPAFTIAVQEAQISKVETLLAAVGVQDIRVLIDGYTKDKHLTEYANVPGASGFLFQDCDFVKILNALTALHPGWDD